MKNIRCSNIPADRRTARSTVAAPTAPAIFALLIAFVGLGLVPAVPAADVPAAINYQGRLTDSEGHPVTGGYYHIEFRLWDNATASGAGNLVWGRMFPLRVADGGTFNVLLSDDGGELKNPTPLTNDLRDAFGDADRYLGITVTRTADGDVLNPAEIAPRQRLVSVPYAFHAQYTEHALRADNALSASNAHHALNSDQLNGLSSTGYLHTARLPGAQSPAVMIQWDGAQASALSIYLQSAALMLDYAMQVESLQIIDSVDPSIGGDTSHGIEFAANPGGGSGDRAWIKAAAQFGPDTLLSIGTQNDAGDDIALSASGDILVTAGTTGSVNIAGSVSMTAPVRMFGEWTTVFQWGEHNKGTNSPGYIPSTDGFVLVDIIAAIARFTIYALDGGQIHFELAADSDDDENYSSHLFPIAKGESWYMSYLDNRGGDTPMIRAHWRPLGK